MTYVYRNGPDAIEREFDWRGEIPATVEHEGRTYQRDWSASQVMIPEHHKADYYSGPKGEKRLARRERQNSEVAKGLANGTMVEGKERPIIGESMTRDDITDFNRKYIAATGRLSP